MCRKEGSPMDNYVRVNIKPHETPKFAEWYSVCKERNIEIIPYITAAIRYYAVTQEFLYIGSVRKEKIVNKDSNRICTYIRKTNDIVAWIAELKEQRIKTVNMVGYILENSIKVDASAETIPKSIELEIRVNALTTKGKPLPSIDPQTIITDDESPILNQKTQESQEEKRKSHHSEPENTDSVNLMELSMFQGLT